MELLLVLLVIVLDALFVLLIAGAYALVVFGGLTFIEVALRRAGLPVKSKDIMIGMTVLGGIGLAFGFGTEGLVSAVGFWIAAIGLAPIWGWSLIVVGPLYLSGLATNGLGNFIPGLTADMESSYSSGWVTNGMYYYGTKFMNDFILVFLGIIVAGVIVVALAAAVDRFKQQSTIVGKIDAAFIRMSEILDSA